MRLLADPLLFKTRIALARLAERFLGGRSLPFVLLLPVAFEIALRMTDFRRFKTLRLNLPPSFWRGAGALRSYVRMIWFWQGSLCVNLFYDRFQSPFWRENIRVTGTPPHRLPSWPARPVVLACLHNSGFLLVRYWLRAQGVPAAGVSLAVPTIYPHAAAIRESGDRRYGLAGVPHIFGPKAVLAMTRFLTPGRALLLPLDGDVPRSRLPYEIDGHPVHLREGAARLAAITGADLLPVSVIQKGFCRFEIRFGDPLPQELIRRDDERPAIQKLGEELWNEVKQNPASISWPILRSLAPKSPATEPAKGGPASHPARRAHDR